MYAFILRLYYSHLLFHLGSGADLDWMAFLSSNFVEEISSNQPVLMKQEPGKLGEVAISKLTIAIASVKIPVVGNSFQWNTMHAIFAFFCQVI